MARQCPGQTLSLLPPTATVEQSVQPSRTWEASGCLHKVPRSLFAKRGGCRARGAQGSSGALAPEVLGGHLLPAVNAPEVSPLLGSTHLCKQAISAAKKRKIQIQQETNQGTEGQSNKQLMSGKAGWKVMTSVRNKIPTFSNICCTEQREEICWHREPMFQTTGMKWWDWKIHIYRTHFTTM